MSVHNPKWIVYSYCCSIWWSMWYEVHSRWSSECRLWAGCLFSGWSVNDSAGSVWVEAQWKHIKPDWVWKQWWRHPLAEDHQTYSQHLRVFCLMCIELSNNRDQFLESIWPCDLSDHNLEASFYGRQRFVVCDERVIFTYRICWLSCPYISCDIIWGWWYY